MILKKNQAVLLLGTNLGDRIAFLSEAKRSISQNIGSILKTSCVYESDSWGYSSLNKFLNQVILIETKNPPFTLLAKTQFIESELGKTSNSKIEFADRPIDIDILFFETQTVNTKELCIPHPEIQNRRFTLVPLCDILSGLKHPTIGKSIHQLLESCQDKIQPKPYFN